MLIFQGDTALERPIITLALYSQVEPIRTTWPWARTLPLDLINGSFKVCGKFQALSPLASCARGRARARARPPRTPSSVSQGIQRFCCMAQKNHAANALVKLNFRCTFVEKRAKNMLPKVGSAGIPRLAALSHFCASGGFQDLRPLCAAL